jgi:hypothetical protein
MIKAREVDQTEIYPFEGWGNGIQRERQRFCSLMGRQGRCKFRCRPEFEMAINVKGDKTLGRQCRVDAG